MILSDTAIRYSYEHHLLEISPWNERQLQPASYDIRLGHHFLLFNVGTYEEIDPKIQQSSLMWPLTLIAGTGSHLLLQPGEFALGASTEYFEFPHNIGGRLEGKSSLGRLGLVIHSTAGFFDPGFKGYCTLELSNLAPLPIRLYPNMPIGQMSFHRIEGTVTHPYAGKYQNQSVKPKASEYWRNFDHDKTKHSIPAV